MALIIGHSEDKVMQRYIQDSSILTLLYPDSSVDQLWSKLEDIAIIIIILRLCCQQPFLVKTPSDNQLSATTSFRFSTEGRMSVVIVLIPDHCLSIYFAPFADKTETVSTCTFKDALEHGLLSQAENLEEYLSAF